MAVNKLGTLRRRADAEGGTLSVQSTWRNAAFTRCLRNHTCAQFLLVMHGGVNTQRRTWAKRSAMHPTSASARMTLAANRPPPPPPHPPPPLRPQTRPAMRCRPGSRTGRRRSTGCRSSRDRRRYLSRWRRRHSSLPTSAGRCRRRAICISRGSLCLQWCALMLPRHVKHSCSNVQPWLGGQIVVCTCTAYGKHRYRLHVESPECVAGSVLSLETKRLFDSSLRPTSPQPAVLITVRARAGPTDDGATAAGSGRCSAPGSQRRAASCGCA